MQMQSHGRHSAQDDLVQGASAIGDRVLRSLRHSLAQFTAEKAQFRYDKAPWVRGLSRPHRWKLLPQVSAKAVLVRAAHRSIRLSQCSSLV